MSEVQVLICDRCKAEIRCEGMNPWRAWKRSVTITASGFDGQPDWISPFEWSGTLCVSCASFVDNALHVAVSEPDHARG